MMEDKDWIGMTLCFVCGQESGIIMDKRMRKTLPKKSCIDKEPCNDCKKIMEKWVIFISVDPNRSDDMTNPYRTGGWVAIKDEAVKRIGIQPAELEEQILKMRVTFIDDETWDALELPREAVPGVPTSVAELR